MGLFSVSLPSFRNFTKSTMPPAYWNTSVRGSGARSDSVLPGFARSSCRMIFRPLFKNAISRKRLASVS